MMKFEIFLKAKEYWIWWFEWHI